MSVDLAAVRRIAHLARIAVSNEEAPHLQDQINAILSFVEALGEVNVEGVEPMTSVIPIKLPMREDVVDDGDIAPLVLANAPLSEDGYFLCRRSWSDRDLEFSFSLRDSAIDRPHRPHARRSARRRRSA